MADRRWIILFVLFLARSAMGFQFQSVASVAPQLAESLAIGYTEIGLLIGLYFLPGALISLPGGFVIQRFGDKPICAFGLFLMMAGGLVLGVSESFTTAFVGRLISGIGAILFNQVLTKMATDWFAGREIIFAMAVVLASWPFGVAAAHILVDADRDFAVGEVAEADLAEGIAETTGHVLRKRDVGPAAEDLQLADVVVHGPSRLVLRGYPVPLP